MNRVLLDIDNTLTNIDLVLRLMEGYFGKEKVEWQDITSYTIGEIFNITKNEDKDFWNKYSPFISKLSTVNQPVVDRINNIINDNDNVVIVTARPETERDITEEWLNINNIKHDKLLLVGKEPKIKTIEELELNVIIDDNPNVFRDISIELNNNRSFLYSAKQNNKLDRYIINYPYNFGLESEKRICSLTGKFI